ncbi:hypothetical protein AABM16_07905 [Moraxella catarrhalis]|uniref:hypothetical protein n=1 Tax=Moraxella catarrhalis TaxID=480 RepID=UPI002358A792|nr:hypothetical protein [Moraxella catarrhalis]
MNKFALIIATALGLSACVAPVSDQGSAMIIGVPVGVPVLIDKSTHNHQDDTVHVCKLKAFTDTFTAENQSRGKARLAVKKKCLTANHEMFCRDNIIECTEYH